MNITMNKLLWSLPQWVHRIIRILTGRIMLRKIVPLEGVTLVSYKWMTVAQYKEYCSEHCSFEKEVSNEL